jgi:hypothetical protein
VISSVCRDDISSKAFSVPLLLDGDGGTALYLIKGTFEAFEKGGIFLLEGL